MDPIKEESKRTIVEASRSSLEFKLANKVGVVYSLNQGSEDAYWEITVRIHPKNCYSCSNYKVFTIKVFLFDFENINCNSAIIGKRWEGLDYMHYDAEPISYAGQTITFGYDLSQYFNVIYGKTPSGGGAACNIDVGFFLIHIQDAGGASTTGISGLSGSIT